MSIAKTREGIRAGAFGMCRARSLLALTIPVALLAGLPVAVGHPTGGGFDAERAALMMAGAALTAVLAATFHVGDADGE